MSSGTGLILEHYGHILKHSGHILEHTGGLGLAGKKKKHRVFPYA
jgi:hypothetical protein